jgi:hypothetical protein
MDIGLGLALRPKVRRKVGRKFPGADFALEADVLTGNLWEYPEFKVPLNGNRYKGTGLHPAKIREALAALSSIGWIKQGRAAGRTALDGSGHWVPAKADSRGPGGWSRGTWRRGPKFSEAFPRKVRVPPFVPRACLRRRRGKRLCDAGNRQSMDCLLGWAGCGFVEHLWR